LGKSYVEQFWNIPARTIIAYLYKVGIQFIHFDSNQERTLRVTAILQSFPCDFVFEVCRTSVFTQVGNNVLSLKAA
jgi:DNA (cytosine-5)-methyltransferase 1